MQKEQNWNRRLFPLILGSFVSAICLFGAYGLTLFPMENRSWAIIALIGVGCFQALIQLIFFFHLGREKKPYWNSVLFVSFLVLILVVVWGTLWILSHLDANLMPWMEEMPRSL